MQDKSEFLLPCLCGELVRTHEPQTVCPKCGRSLEVVGWGDYHEIHEDEPVPVLDNS